MQCNESTGANNLGYRIKMGNSYSVSHSIFECILYLLLHVSFQ